MLKTWVKEVVTDRMKRGDGFKIDLGAQYKTWRLIKYKKGEKSQGKVLPGFWFG